MDTIYLDIAKAFDSVPHERLLEKAKGYGIREDILRVDKAIHKGTTAEGRCQWIYKSSWCDVKSGVHREVSLGPCCFYFSLTTCQTKSNAISSCLQMTQMY